ncbi:MAG: CoA transferase [Actinomycetota bacterium]|nr:CoA transferase [Actinomycetota bacterium]
MTVPQVTGPLGERPAPDAPAAPLAGVRVLEVANMIAAPSMAALMADLGASVVKVEPLTGDILRNAVIDGPGPDPYFELDNRGKRGIAVDLSTAEGIALVHRLAQSADVLVTNLTADRMAKYRLSADDVATVAPRCIHASLSGYGTTGEDAGRLAYDMTAFFARGGVQSLVSEPDGAPPAFRPGQGDHTSALALLAATLAALRLRDTTGHVAPVEVALMQVATWTIASDLSVTLVSGTGPQRWPREEWPSPLTCRFRCADDLWIAFCMPGPRDFWEAFARCVDRPEWVDDPRFATPIARRANAADLIAACDDIFATRSRDHWSARLDAAGLTWGPIQTVESLVDDPTLHELGGLHLIDDHPSGPFHTVAAPFHLRGADVTVRGRAPELGEHTRAVLAEAGLTETEIEELVEARVVGTL